MNRFLWTGVLGLTLSFGAAAQDLNQWATAHDTTKVGDLTVGDLKALAEAQSIEIQKARYVHVAEISSFLLPGLGQFEVGDPLGGTLNLVGQAALVGGAFYGSWALLPSDLQNSSLSNEARRSLTRHYWVSDPGKIVPSTAVMVGGLTLAVIQRFWASSDAGARAKANVASGKVTFQPDLSIGHFGMRAWF